MKKSIQKPLLVAGVLLFANAAYFASAQESHPWLAQQLKKQRYPCPKGNSPERGPATAQVTIDEFIDYDCPYCRGQEADIKKLLAAYPTQVKLVFKNLPLDVHSEAKHKAIVAECMGEQGRFWEAHDQLLAGAPINKVTEGVDKGKLNACVSRGGDGQVAADLGLAKNLGLATTPSFVIDGIRQGGTIGFPQLKLLVDAELARKGGTN